MTATKLSKSTAADLDSLTAKYTAFKTFADLLDAGGKYRPSLYCNSAEDCRLASGGRISAAKHRAELTKLADEYDAAQAARGDNRRAFRS